MKDFKNRVAVVTGAASGIGRGLAERCLQEGMKVVLADVESGALTQAATELQKTGVDITSVVTDISEMDDVKNLAQKTIETYGRVDALFNNAGVAAGAALWESTLNDCKWVIDVNLWGIIHCIRAFVPIMLAQNTPCHIVNTSSIAGLTTFHPSALYHLTKHGIVALSEQLYHDLAIRGAPIKVSVLCPGFVDTRIMDAERNRPDKYANPSAGADPSTAPYSAEAMFRRMVKNGISPAAVAEMVFQAMAAKRFFIFTHPEMEPQIRSRWEAILESRNPVLPPMAGPENGIG